MLRVQAGELVKVPSCDRDIKDPMAVFCEVGLFALAALANNPPRQLGTRLGLLAAV